MKGGRELRNCMITHFNGDEDNYDKWEIQWKEFAQVENIVSALGKALDTNMPESIVDYKKSRQGQQTKH